MNEILTEDAYRYTPNVNVSGMMVTKSKNIMTACTLMSLILYHVQLNDQSREGYRYTNSYSVAL